MSELASAQGPISAAQGQAPAEPAAPMPADGQAQGQTPTQTDGKAPAQSAQAPTIEPQFVDLDPSKLPPELLTVYKNMQSAFTKKSQSIAQERQKIEVYNAFMADPVGSLRRMASQYGLTVDRPGDNRPMTQQQAGQTGQAQDGWQPKSWQEVLERATQEAEARIAQKFSPLLQNVQNLHAQSVEQQLAQIDPNWRVYEDDMREMIQQHPSLVNDVGKLYKLSVPDSVLASRSTQAALKKLEGTAQAAQVHGRSQTPASGSVPAPKTIKSFDDAVAEAKRQLSSQGR